MTILLGHGFDEPATLRFVPIGLADMYGIYSVVEQPTDGRASPGTESGEVMTIIFIFTIVVLFLESCDNLVGYFLARR